MILNRCPANPLITRSDIPDVPPDIADVSSVMNPGAVVIDGRHGLLLRVQTRARETFLMTAWSEDGESFRVAPEAVSIHGLGSVGAHVHHVYDPRVTVVEDDMLVTLSPHVLFGRLIAAGAL